MSLLFPAAAVRKAVTPSEEYFYHHVLAWSGGIEDIGVVNWPLLGALGLVWLLAGLALIRGIQSLGKVSSSTAKASLVMCFRICIRESVRPSVTYTRVELLRNRIFSLIEKKKIATGV